MTNINLSYKCPHCNHINENVTPYQPSGSAYLSYGTGNPLPHISDKTLQFTCYQCQKPSLFEILLIPL